MVDVAICLLMLLRILEDFMSDHYILGETYETTVPWDKIEQVCNAVAKKSTRTT